MSNLHGEMIRELQVNVSDSLVGFIIVACLEGREPTAKLKAKDAKTPDVDSPVMRLFQDHLRWQIVKGTTEGLSLVVRSVDTPTKVCYFYGTLNTQLI